MKRGIILNEDDLREVVKYFTTKDAFVFDVEATGPHRNVPHLANVTWMGLATDGVAVTIPFGHPNGSRIIGEKPEFHQYKTGKKIGDTYSRMVPVYDDPPPQMSAGKVFEILKPLFWKPQIRKTGHNLIYDLTATAKYWGEVAPPPYDDTIVMQWLLDENMLRKDLKTLTKKYYGADYDKEGVGKAVEKYPLGVVDYYLYCDVVYDWLLRERFNPQIDEEGLREIYNLEMDVLNVLVGMQLHGAKVDVPRLEQLQVDLKVQVEQAEAEIYKAAGKRFNVNSTPQKQKILYGPKPEGQGLKPWKLTKGGKGKTLPEITDYSTDSDVLASYPGNKVAVALTKYQDVNKILTTYVTGWLGDGAEKSSIIYNDHIHADFVQYGTVTGRFSCREPNLQNIPRPSSDLGRMVRGAFISEEGGKLIVADYGQIELVVLAHYLGQGKLYDGFIQGIDPHTMTAAMVLGKRPEEITKDERQRFGKTLNFAVVYGAGINKVAALAEVPVSEAKQILAKHARQFPEIPAFRDEVIRITKSRKPQPYLTTLMGRKRRITGLYARDDGIRMSAERQTFNSLIQGGAADLIKFAMVRVDGLLPPEVSLILTVHDEIVLASPESMAQEASLLLKEAMTGEGIQSLVKVPLLADVKIVDRWSDAK